MKKHYFVTGTDTEVGKTQVACALLQAAAQASLKTVGLKPIAAGAEEQGGVWVNEDALALQEAASVKLPYASVNPVLLKEPMAPHIAAEREQKRVTVSQLAGFCRGTLMTAGADFALIEGAGGWRVPVNPRETLADLAKELNHPVILVVGMKLGCLNHALLTAEAIQRDGLSIAGWVANRIDPDMTVFDENLATLERMMPAPLIGVLPHLSNGVIPDGWAHPGFFRAK